MNKTKNASRILILILIGVIALTGVFFASQFNIKHNNGEIITSPIGFSDYPTSDQNGNAITYVNIGDSTNFDDRAVPKQEGGVYVVTNAREFLSMCYDNGGKTFRLDANFKIDGRKWIENGPGGGKPFNGTMQANNKYIVTGVNVGYANLPQNTNVGGLFQSVGGNIYDLNFCVARTAWVNAWYNTANVFAGGLAAKSSGTISNCNFYYYGNVANNKTTNWNYTVSGGLIGQNTGRIVNSKMIIGDNTSLRCGQNTSGWSYVGGLAGENKGGTIENILYYVGKNVEYKGAYKNLTPSDVYGGIVVGYNTGTLKNLIPIKRDGVENGIANHIAEEYQIGGTRVTSTLPQSQDTTGKGYIDVLQDNTWSFDDFLDFNVNWDSGDVNNKDLTYTVKNHNGMYTGHYFEAWRGGTDANFQNKNTTNSKDPISVTLNTADDHNDIQVCYYGGFGTNINNLSFAEGREWSRYARAHNRNSYVYMNGGTPTAVSGAAAVVNNISVTDNIKVPASFNSFGSSTNKFTGIITTPNETRLKVEVENGTRGNDNGGLVNFGEGATIEKIIFNNAANNYISGDDGNYGMISAANNCTVRNCETSASSIFVLEGGNSNNHIGGVFGKANNCTIDNVNVTGFAVTVDSNASKVQCVGGYIGYTSGTNKIINCTSNLDTNFVCLANGVEASNYGGIVGQVSGANILTDNNFTITTKYTMNIVNVDDSSYGNDYLGGVIGSTEVGSTTTVLRNKIQVLSGSAMVFTSGNNALNGNFRAGGIVGLLKAPMDITQSVILTDLAASNFVINNTAGANAKYGTYFGGINGASGGAYAWKNVWTINANENLKIGDGTNDQLYSVFKPNEVTIYNKQDNGIKFDFVADGSINVTPSSGPSGSPLYKHYAEDKNGGYNVGLMTNLKDKNANEPIFAPKYGAGFGVEKIVDTSITPNKDIYRYHTNAGIQDKKVDVLFMYRELKDLGEFNRFAGAINSGCNYKWIKGEFVSATTSGTGTPIKEISGGVAVPVGTETNKFMGTFEGNNFVLNLDGVSSQNGVLFGYNAGTVQNLTLNMNGVVHLPRSLGKDVVYENVNTNFGIIANVNSGTINNVNLNWKNLINVIGFNNRDQQIGAYVGVNEASGTISNAEMHVSGNATITHTTNTKTNARIGGFAGRNFGAISNVAFNIDSINTGLIKNDNEPKDDKGVALGSTNAIGAFIGAQDGGNIQNIGVSVFENSLIYNDVFSVQGVMFGYYGASGINTNLWCAYTNANYVAAPANIAPTINLMKLVVTGGISAYLNASLTETNDLQLSAPIKANVEYVVAGWFSQYGGTTSTKIPPSEGANGAFYVPKTNCVSKVYTVVIMSTTISDYATLKTLATTTNSGNDFRGTEFKLASSIVLGADFTPIGTASNPFAGKLNGSGYSIIINETTKFVGKNASLFGYIKSFPKVDTASGLYTQLASVYNLVVEIKNSKLDYSAYEVVAPIVAYNYGGEIGYSSSIEKVGTEYKKQYKKNSETVVNITNSVITGNTGANYLFGGVVGYNYNVANSNGTIFAVNVNYIGSNANLTNIIGNNIGGLVGQNNADIIGCKVNFDKYAYINKNVLDLNAGVIANENTGMVDATIANITQNDFTQYSNAIVNSTRYAFNNNTSENLNDVFVVFGNTKLITDDDSWLVKSGLYANKINSIKTMATGVGLSISSDISAENGEAIVSFKIEYTVADPTNPYNEKYLNWIDDLSCYGIMQGADVGKLTYTPENKVGKRIAAIYIKTVIETQKDFFENVFVQNNAINGLPGIQYTLATNITVDNVNVLYPLGTKNKPFLGKINGGGFAITINNTTAKDIETASIFGYLGDNKNMKDGVATVENLVVNVNGFEQANIYDKVKYFGILANINSGTIKNCTVNVSDAVNMSFDDGNPNEYLGGAVGLNNYKVENVNVVMKNNGKLQASNVGGVVGYNKGTIVNSKLSTDLLSRETATLVTSNVALANATYKVGYVGFVSAYNEGTIRDTVLNIPRINIEKLNTTVVNVAGITGINAGALLNNTVNVNNSITDATEFGGLSCESINNATVQGNTVNYNANVSATDFNGLTNTTADGNSVKNNIVNFNVSKITATNFAGASLNGYGEVSGNTINFNTSSNVVAKNISGLVGKNYATKLSNNTICVDKEATLGDSVKTLQISLLIGENVSSNIIENNLVTIYNEVFADKNATIGIMVAKSTQINESNVSNNLVVKNNKYAYKLVGDSNNSYGFNAINVINDQIKEKFSITRNANGNFVFEITFGEKVYYKWFSDIVNYTQLTTNELSNSITNNMITSKIVFDKTNKNIKYFLSFYKLQISENAVLGAEEMSFSDFAGLDISLFSNVKFQLNSDVNYFGTISIAGNDVPFNAIFDGQNHQITLNKQSVSKYAGLFGTIGEAGKVCNLVVNVKESQGLSNSVATGGLAGVINGSVENVVVAIKNGDGTVQHPKVSFNATSNAGVSKTGAMAGVVGAGASFKNTWVVMQKNAYKLTDKTEKLGINVVSILGAIQDVSAIMTEVAGNTSIKFTASTKDGLFGWFDNYEFSNVTMTVEDNYTVTVEDKINVDYTVSYLNTKIKTEEELRNLSNTMSVISSKGIKFELLNDIVVTVAKGAYSPLGMTGKPFEGTFDGGYHKVTFNHDVEMLGENTGMFGTLARSAKVYNLHVDFNTNKINASAINAGALAGYCDIGSNNNDGYIRDVIVTNDMLPSAPIAGNYNGVFGSTGNTFDNNTNNSNVWFVSNNQALKATNKTENVVINTIYSKATVYSKSAVAPDNSGTIEAFFSNGIINLTATPDGASKFYGYVDVKNSKTLQSSNVYKVNSPVTYGNFMAVFADTNIDSLAKFNSFREAINDFVVLANGSNKFWDANIPGVVYKLTFALTLDNNYVAIGTNARPFNATFDATGSVISITANSKLIGENAGLFGVVGKKGILQNIIINCASKTGEESITKNSGAVVAVNNGTLKNIAVNYTNTTKNFGTNNKIFGVNNGKIENIWLVEKNYSTINADNANLLGVKQLRFIDNDSYTIGWNASNMVVTTATAKYFIFDNDLNTILPQRGTTAVLDNNSKAVNYVASISNNIANAENWKVLKTFYAEVTTKLWAVNGLNFFITNDIDFGNINAEHYIIATQDDPFQNTLNGLDHTITIGDITGLEVTALISKIGVNGKVCNLVVKTNGTFNATRTLKDKTVFAGFVGESDGVYENVVGIAGENTKFVATFNGITEKLTKSDGFGVITGTYSRNATRSSNVWIVNSTRNIIETTISAVMSGFNQMVYVGNPTSNTVTLAKGKITFTTPGNFYLEGSDVPVASGTYVTTATDTNTSYNANNIKLNIENADDLNQIAYDVNAGFANVEYTVVNALNIDMTKHISIGNATNKFKGKINGGDHRIQLNGIANTAANVPTKDNGVYKSSNYAKALFGYIDSTASFDKINIEITGLFVFEKGDVTGVFAKENAARFTGLSVNMNANSAIYGSHVAVFVGINHGSASIIEINLNGSINASSNGNAIASGLIVINDTGSMLYRNDGFNGVRYNGSIKAETHSIMGSKAIATVIAGENYGSIGQFEILIDGNIESVTANESCSAVTAVVTGYNGKIVEEIDVKFTDKARLISTNGNVAGLVGNNNAVFRKSIVHLNKNDVSAIFVGKNVCTDSFGNPGTNVWTLLTSQIKNNQNTAPITVNSNTLLIAGIGSVDATIGKDVLMFKFVQENQKWGFNGLYNSFNAGQKITGIENSTYVSSGDPVKLPYLVTFAQNVIEDLADLMALATSINSGTKYEDLQIKLKNDITIDLNTYIAIGTNANPFNFTFDGDNKTITFLNVVLNNAAGGVFGVVGKNGIIYNLNVKVNNSTISGTNVGAIAGVNNGSIICKNADINYETNAYSVTISANSKLVGEEVGGAVGLNNGKIAGAKVENFGIIGDATIAIRAGGVVGYNQGSVENSKFINENLVVASRYAAGIAGANTNVAKIENVKISGKTGYTAEKTAMITAYTTSAINMAIIDAVNYLAPINVKIGDIKLNNVWYIYVDSGFAATDGVNFIGVDSSNITTTITPNGFEFVFKAEDNKFTVWNGTGANASNNVLVAKDIVQNAKYIVYNANTISNEMEYDAFVNSLNTSYTTYNATATITLMMNLDLTSYETIANMPVNFNGSGYTIKLNKTFINSNKAKLSNIIFDYVGSSASQSIVAINNTGLVSNIVLYIGGTSFNNSAVNIIANGEINNGTVIANKNAVINKDASSDNISFKVVYDGGKIVASIANEIVTTTELPEDGFVKIGNATIGNLIKIYFVKPNIATESDLQLLSSLSYETFTRTLDKITFNLTCDVDVNSTFKRIQSFSDIFNGNGHKITFNAVQTEKIGFVSSNSGTIKNVVFVNKNMAICPTLDGGNRQAIVAYTNSNSGIIQNVIVNNENSTVNDIATNLLGASQIINCWSVSKNTVDNIAGKTGSQATNILKANIDTLHWAITDTEIVFSNDAIVENGTVFTGFLPTNVPDGVNRYATLTTNATFSGRVYSVYENIINKIISTLTDWNAIVDKNKAGINFAGATFELQNDLTITADFNMFTSEFAGNINGNAHNFIISNVRAGALFQNFTGTLSNMIISYAEGAKQPLTTGAIKLTDVVLKDIIAPLTGEFTNVWHITDGTVAIANVNKINIPVANVGLNISSAITPTINAGKVTISFKNSAIANDVIAVKSAGSFVTGENYLTYTFNTNNANNIIIDVAPLAKEAGVILIANAEEFTLFYKALSNGLSNAIKLTNNIVVNNIDTLANNSVQIFGNNKTITLQNNSVGLFANNTAKISDLFINVADTSTFTSLIATSSASNLSQIIMYVNGNKSVANNFFVANLTGSEKQNIIIASNFDKDVNGANIIKVGSGVASITDNAGYELTVTPDNQNYFVCYDGSADVYTNVLKLATVTEDITVVYMSKTIATEAQYNEVATIIDAHSANATFNSVDKVLTLTADIAFAGATPTLAKFNGTFEGGMHALTLNSIATLFGAGTVNNLLINANLAGAASEVVGATNQQNVWVITNNANLTNTNGGRLVFDNGTFVGNTITVNNNGGFFVVTASTTNSNYRFALEGGATATNDKITLNNTKGKFDYKIIFSLKPATTVKIIKYLSASTTLVGENGKAFARLLVTSSDGVYTNEPFDIGAPIFVEEGVTLTIKIEIIKENMKNSSFYFVNWDNGNVASAMSTTYTVQNAPHDIVAYFDNLNVNGNFLSNFVYNGTAQAVDKARVVSGIIGAKEIVITGDGNTHYNDSGYPITISVNRGGELVGYAEGIQFINRKPLSAGEFEIKVADKNYDGTNKVLPSQITLAIVNEAGLKVAFNDKSITLTYEDANVKASGGVVVNKKITINSAGNIIIIENIVNGSTYTDYEINKADYLNLSSMITRKVVTFDINANSEVLNQEYPINNKLGFRVNTTNVELPYKFNGSLLYTIDEASKTALLEYYKVANTLIYDKLMLGDWSAIFSGAITADHNATNKDIPVGSYNINIDNIKLLDASNANFELTNANKNINNAQFVINKLKGEITIGKAQDNLKIIYGAIEATLNNLFKFTESALTNDKLSGVDIKIDYDYNNNNNPLLLFDGKNYVVIGDSVDDNGKVLQYVINAKVNNPNVDLKVNPLTVIVEKRNVDFVFDDAKNRVTYNPQLDVYNDPTIKFAYNSTILPKFTKKVGLGAPIDGTAQENIVCKHPINITLFDGTRNVSKNFNLKTTGYLYVDKIAINVNVSKAQSKTIYYSEHNLLDLNYTLSAEDMIANKEKLQGFLGWTNANGDVNPTDVNIDGYNITVGTLSIKDAFSKYYKVNAKIHSKALLTILPLEVELVMDSKQSVIYGNTIDTSKLTYTFVKLNNNVETIVNVDETQLAKTVKICAKKDTKFTDISGEINKVGEYFIITDVTPKNNNYKVVAKTALFKVAPKDIEITVKNGSKQYNQDVSVAPRASLVDEKQLVGTDKLANLQIKFSWKEEVGVQNVSAASGNKNYTVTVKGEKAPTMTIDKAHIIISVSEIKKVQGGKDPSYVIEFSGNVNEDEVYGSLGREIGEDSGEYKITAGNLYLDESKYTYEFNLDNAKLVITKAKNNDMLFIIIGSVTAAAGIALLAVGIVLFTKKKKSII